MTGRRIWYAVYQGATREVTTPRDDAALAWWLAELLGVIDGLGRPVRIGRLGYRAGPEMTQPERERTQSDELERPAALNERTQRRLRRYFLGPDGVGCVRLGGVRVPPTYPAPALMEQCIIGCVLARLPVALEAAVVERWSTWVRYQRELRLSKRTGDRGEMLTLRNRLKKLSKRADYKRGMALVEELLT